MASSQLLDHRGQPMVRSDLKRDVAAAKFGTVRSPLSGSPGDGLDPSRLATILRSADQGDPIQYLELAEIAEERNPHYLGVLGTRKRSVAQIPITVEPASDDAADIDWAARIEKWLKRKELQLELFDILDAIGKGYSFTEIVWDESQLQWEPARLEYRDPRWFRFERHDLRTPVMLDDNGMEKPLPGGKFIFARIAAKSGLPIRSGIARAIMWTHMFKLYTERDWAIFTQTYGQPLRVGKWGPGASEDDKDTLFRAVANIAGDCAAIIPESMQIEFITSQNVGSSLGLYKERAEFLDKQISKAVLGQTATTDAETGGLGSGKEHRQVQEDIETADCAVLSAILTRDLASPWTMLERGPDAASPTITIGRPEPEDVAALVSALGTVVPLGLRVSTSQLYDKLGLTPPAKGDEILGQPSADPGPGAVDGDETALNTAGSVFKRVLNGHLAQKPPTTPETHSRRSTGRSAPADPTSANADLAIEITDADIEAILEMLSGLADDVSSLPELAERIRASLPDLDSSALTDTLAEALMAAHAAGRAQIEDEDG